MKYLGIDIGASRAKLMLTDVNGRPIDHYTFRYRNRATDPNWFYELHEEHIKKIIIANPEIAWTVIGIPGVRTKNGYESVNMKIPNEFWSTYENMECFTITNDGHVAMLGAINDDVSDDELTCLISLGSGVGGGIAIGNNVITGKNHAAAEFGHFPIDARFFDKPNKSGTDGTFLHRQSCKSGCGGPNCFEPLLAPANLYRIARAVGDHNKDSVLTPEQITDGRREQFKKTWDMWCRLNADLICKIQTAIDPAKVVISGGITDLDDLENDLRNAYRVYGDIGWKPHYVAGRDFEIKVSEHKSYCGAFGAARLASQEHEKATKI